MARCRKAPQQGCRMSALWRRALWLVALLAGLSAVPSLRADLTWQRKTVELNPDGKSSVLEARFPFANTGTTPVDIQQVQTSCGCTTVALAQRHFEPGQKGEIVARYAVGEQVGLQKKAILVSTAGNPVATALTLVVHIPELVRLQPASVSWNQDGGSEAKVITLESADARTLPLKDVVVLSSSDTLTTSLEPVLAGSKYEIRVTPKTTGKQLFATLVIHCHVGGQEKIYHVYASVQPAPPPAPQS
jgi:hypothetical protein